MRVAVIGLGIGSAALLLSACTSSGEAAPAPSTQVETVIATKTPSGAATAPVPTGPTTTARATSCPLLGTQEAANRVGMRLARITVLRSGGNVVGCRFYALQHSYLHDTEHLPGPNQPAVEIEAVRYASDTAAHNAFVREAERGENPQQARIGNTTGVCFQTDFYQPDKHHDWACAFNVGDTKVAVRTVVVSGAFDVIEVARAVARQL